MKLRLASTALDGRTVTLTLLQDGVTVGPLNVAAWGTPDAPSTATIDVTVKRAPTMAAPEAVSFKVEGWTGFATLHGDTPGHDRRRHEIVYLWNFGDAGATYTAPVNVMTEWRDANKGYGSFVSHVYATPGEKTASCLAIEPATGRTANYSFTFTVADPDVVFAGRTAYFSPDGDFSDAPAGAVQVNSFKEAMTLYQYKEVGLPCRVMFARGKEFISDGYTNIPGSPDSFSMGGMRGPIHIVAGPGNKARPIVRPSARTDARNVFASSPRQPSKEVTIVGMDLVGPWDPVTETWLPGHENLNQNGVVIYHVGYTLIHDMKMSGFSAPVSRMPPTYNNEPRGDFAGTGTDFAAEITYTFVSNCNVFDWQNFGMWGASSRNYSLLGVVFAQNNRANPGGSKAFPPRFNNHGCVRLNNPLTQPHDVYVDGCDFFSSTGWVGGEFIMQQPAFRNNQDMAFGSTSNFQRSSFEGGYSLLEITRQNGRNIASASDVLVDHCAFVTTHMSRSHIRSEGTGYTVRNSLFVSPDFERIDPYTTYEAFIKMDEAGPAGGVDFTAPLVIENNTFLNLQTKAKDFRLSGGRSEGGREIPLFFNNTKKTPSDLRVSNNINHQPFIDTPVVTFGPLSKTPLWTPRCLGYKFTPDTVLPNASATPPDSVWAAIPGVGSSAIGGATSDAVPYDDMRGRVRPVHPSVGAREAAR